MARMTIGDLLFAEHERMARSVGEFQKLMPDFSRMFRESGILAFRGTEWATFTDQLQKSAILAEQLGRAVSPLRNWPGNLFLRQLDETRATLFPAFKDLHALGEIVAGQLGRSQPHMAFESVRRSLSTGFALSASAYTENVCQALRGQTLLPDRILSLGQKTAKSFEAAVPQLSVPQRIVGALHVVDTGRAVESLTEPDENDSSVELEVELPPALEGLPAELTALVESELGNLSSDQSEMYSEGRRMLMSGSAVYVPLGMHKAKDLIKGLLTALAPQERVAQLYGVEPTRVSKKLRVRYALGSAARDHEKFVLSMEEFYVHAANEVGALSHVSRVPPLHGAAWSQILDSMLYFLLQKARRRNKGGN